MRESPARSRLPIRPRAHELRPEYGRCCCRSLCGGGAGLVGTGGARQRHPAYVLPSPYVVFQTLVGAAVLSNRSASPAHHAGRFIAAASAASRWRVFNQSKWLEYSLFPYAVILQVRRDRNCAAMLIYCRSRRVTSALVVGSFRSFPTPRRLNSVDAIWPGCFALCAHGCRRCGTEIAPRCRILGGLRIAGGLSLIGAVVAEIAAGTAGAGSGLAFRIAESGYRLNIPRMFAALLLLSVAGIVIYGLLALVSHLVLRRWHESALGKEN